MTKFKKQATSKLFYGKWSYKIELICHGAYMVKRQGIEFAKNYCLDTKPVEKWFRHIDKNNLLYFIQDVEPFLTRKDLQIRSEGSIFNIFCKDVNLFNELCSKLSSWISVVHEPVNDLEKEFINNNSKKVLCNHIPYKIYNYKVYLKTNISLRDRDSFRVWVDKYKGKILLPDGVRNWLNYSKKYIPNPYIYVEDKSMLSMIGLFLGNHVQKIEQFIPRSSINTIIDQEQTCPL